MVNVGKYSIHGANGIYIYIQIYIYIYLFYNNVGYTGNSIQKMPNKRPSQVIDSDLIQCDYTIIMGT